MKKSFSFLLAIVVLTSFSACNNDGNKPGGSAHPGETPMGVQYREEKGYLTYTNDTYMFRIDYHDIFTETQEGENGIILTSDSCELRAWGKDNSANLTVEESYKDAIAHYTDVENDVCGKRCYAFEFTDGTDRRGYCYSMFVQDTFYTFRFIYPTEKRDDYETYCVDMTTTFVVTGTRENQMAQ